MLKETLLIAREVIAEALHEIAINDLDRLELLINLSHFLDENNYDENIKVLHKNKRRIYEGTNKTR